MDFPLIPVIFTPSSPTSQAQEELMDPEPTNTTTSVVPPSTPSLAIAADESASSIVAEALSAVVSNNNTTTNYDNSSSSESAATTVVAAEPEKKKKKKTRCALCRANVGVICKFSTWLLRFLVNIFHQIVTNRFSLPPLPIVIQLSPADVT